jgi:hypothetical protein
VGPRAPRAFSCARFLALSRHTFDWFFLEVRSTQYVQVRLRYNWRRSTAVMTTVERVERPMRLKRAAVAALALTLASSVYADNPFIGKWKIDEAKSHLTGATDSIAASGPNTWSFQDGAFPWKVRADGTDQPTAFGTTAMKVVNATTWEFTYKSNGKTTGTETWVLSADGQSMKRAPSVFRMQTAKCPAAPKL